MLFSSFVFAGLFLPVSLFCFWLAPTDRAKRAVLLGASLIYYSFWLPAYIFLLIALVGVAWACARIADRTTSVWPVVLAATILLGTLAFFKYSSFVNQILADIGIMGGAQQLFPTVALPLGISFIVFQALGYVIDVHRREFSAEPRFEVVLLFKAFFPQLIAGPICRAHELIPQLRGTFRINAAMFFNGIAIFVIGLFLKNVFADGLGPLVDDLYAQPQARSRGDAWAAAIGFGMQIYADFWGYSTMAVGLAMLFGISIPVNFKLPYIATSIREFWRRWHITLSQWLRDYLYKPLGGSRHGMRRTMFALFVTMLLGGLWHGANYTFIVWGALHGTVLIGEHMFGSRCTIVLERLPSVLRSWFGWFYTMLVVFVAWVFFRAASVSDALRLLHELVAGTSMPLSLQVRQIFALSAALFLIQLPLEWGLGRLRTGTVDIGYALIFSFLLLLSAVVLSAPVAAPFIYFQF